MSQFMRAKAGLFLGDALSRSTSVQRLSLISEKRFQRFQSLQAFAFSNRQTNVIEPYTHGAPGEILTLRAGDDTEWFAFSQHVLRKGGDFASAWSDLANQKNTVRGKISVLSALDNLALGKLAPHTGHDNPHYLDNAGVIRALAHLEISDSWESARESIVADVSHTNSEDGLWCALAMAKTLWLIANGSAIKVAIEAGLLELPADSLSLRVITEYLSISSLSGGAFDLAISIETSQMDRIYSYPYGAAETVGLCLSYLRLNADTESTFSACFMHSRYNDSLPAILGFCLGLVQPDNWLSKAEHLVGQPLDGLCIPWLKGKTIF